MRNQWDVNLSLTLYKERLILHTHAHMSHIHMHPTHITGLSHQTRKHRSAPSKIIVFNGGGGCALLNSSVTKSGHCLEILPKVQIIIILTSKTADL